MRIRIRSSDGPNLFLPVPTGLLCNRLTAAIAARVLAQNGMFLEPKQLAKLFRVIRDCKRRNRDWVLVEVYSADGDQVYVKP